MKRILALLLSFLLLLTGCGQLAPSEGKAESNITQKEADGAKSTPIDDPSLASQEVNSSFPLALSAGETATPVFNGMNDPALLRYVEDNLYQHLIADLSEQGYFVENISAVYVSQEYIDELAYNSQANIFFGYTLDELEEEFQGAKYVFTLGENGETIVVPFEDYDDTYERVLTNVAIGTGVILICVVVSVATYGAGAPAAAMIFAAAAKSGAIMAASSAALSGVAAGVVTGLETNDFDEALKAGALAGSEGFKWGAIGGAISGGTMQAVALHGATLNGLTMNEAALIQHESGYPLDVIKSFKSMDQYNICKEAGLTPHMINGKIALVRDIDINYVDNKGFTNLQRMMDGDAALDPKTGLSYQLHHIGQKTDSTLSILTQEEHMQKGNNLIWHILGNPSEVHGPGNNWDSQRKLFWTSMAQLYAAG